MGIFNLKRPKAEKILSEKKEKDIYCHFCGKKLGKFIGYGEEVEDGTDDVYDVCPDCGKHFEELLRKEKEDKNNAGT